MRLTGVVVDAPDQHPDQQLVLRLKVVDGDLPATSFFSRILP